MLWLTFSRSMMRTSTSLWSRDFCFSRLLILTSSVSICSSCSCRRAVYLRLQCELNTFILKLWQVHNSDLIKHTQRYMVHTYHNVHAYTLIAFTLNNSHKNRCLLQYNLTSETKHVRMYTTIQLDYCNNYPIIMLELFLWDDNIKINLGNRTWECVQDSSCSG